jgi:hypothetical protein
VVLAWRCTSCKVILTALDKADERWKWTGERYEHRCDRWLGGNRWAPADRVEVSIDRDQPRPPAAG